MRPRIMMCLSDISIALIMLATMMIACTRPLTFYSSPLSVVATTTPVPPTDTPTLTSTPTRTPIPTTTPTSTPTPGPYTDAPFSLVFVRNDDLWITEVGSAVERQLTDEPLGWEILDFAVSPDGKRAAYILREPATLDAMIKVVDLKSGSIEVVIGEGDVVSEGGLRWLDAEHLAYVRGEFCVQGREGCYEAVFAGEDHPEFDHLIISLSDGTITHVPHSHALYWSPDGRFELTCYRGGYVYEGPCPYILRDRSTGETWQVTTDEEWAGFMNWWPDDRTMLFYVCKNGPEQCDIVLIDVATLERRPLRAAEAWRSPSEVIYSPDGHTIAYQWCEWIDDQTVQCGFDVIEADGTSRRQINPPDDLYRRAQMLSWSPDGTRIIFCELIQPGYTDRNIWSVRVDGTDLRLLVSNVWGYQAFTPAP